MRSSVKREICETMGHQRLVQPLYTSSIVTGRCISYSAGRVDRFNMFSKNDKIRPMTEAVENPWVFIVQYILVFSLVFVGYEAILFNGELLRSGIQGAVTGILVAGISLSYLQWREEE